MKKCYLLIGLLFVFLRLDATQEDLLQRRVYAHLLLSDTKSAIREAESALKELPDSQRLQLAYLQALSEGGEEMRSLQAWSQMGSFSIKDPAQRKMLEMLAWGVLRKAESSSQVMVKLDALIGAVYTNDAKAIPLLLAQMRSSNASIRALAVRLASQFADAPLKNEIARLLREEKVWFVKLEVIAAVGRLRLYTLKSDLKEIVTSPASLVEEKAAAIHALASIYENVEAQELKALSSSSRAGLRQLAAELIGILELKEHAHRLEMLLCDCCPDVKISALNSLALLRLERVGSKSLCQAVEPLLDDVSSDVAISAAYVLLLAKQEKAEDALASWIRSDQPSCRRLASAAIGSSGKYGVRVAIKEFLHTKDPYVKVNLAKVLIGQRTQVEMAAVGIHEVLTQEKRALWMWEEDKNPLFRSLGPTQVKQREGIPNYPLAVDQLTRIELLSVLNLAGYSKTQEAVREFLKTRSWMVSSVAASFLIQEGKEEDFEVVRDLLQDPDPMVRSLAALILATFARDSAAIQVLQEAYGFVDRDVKINILAAMGYIGDPDCIPFLLGVLKEPFQVLRVVAASALIQCLYH